MPSVLGSLGQGGGAVPFHSSGSQKLICSREQLLLVTMNLRKAQVELALFATKPGPGAAVCKLNCVLLLLQTRN